jgi:hypothetical protein
MEEFPVLKYTVQLYYSPDTKNMPVDVDGSRPSQIASGVLIKNKSKYFLLTCKHVFDNIKLDDAIILTSAGFAVRLPKEIMYINNINNSIDLALIQLKGERLKHMKAHYSFLPMQNLGFKHLFDEELWYMLFGFINKKTILKDYAFYVESFGFLTTIRRYRKIEKIGFNYDNNITLEYNCRKQNNLNDDDGTRKFGPKDLKGLSGGGIWLSVAGERANTFNYVLVGIMIEERIDRGFIIGTKINLIEKYIRDI